MSEPENPPAPPIRTYLGWALAATVLCFLPLGLVSLYFGLRASQAVAEGRTEDAARKSRVARRWLIAAIAVGLLVYLVFAIAFAALGAFSS